MDKCTTLLRTLFQFKIGWSWMVMFGFDWFFYGAVVLVARFCLHCTGQMNA
jgi:hypothetical protein